MCAAATPDGDHCGADWAPACNTGLRGAPFVALNGDLREEVDFGGNFVVHPDDLHNEYKCGLCNMPARAGKTRKAKAEAGI